MAEGGERWVRDGNSIIVVFHDPSTSPSVGDVLVLDDDLALRVDDVNFSPRLRGVRVTLSPASVIDLLTSSCSDRRKGVRDELK
jgi:hypothetical protein